MDFDTPFTFKHDGRTFRCMCQGSGVASVTGDAQARIANAQWHVEVDDGQYVLFECDASDTEGSVRQRVIAWWDSRDPGHHA